LERADADASLQRLRRAHQIWGWVGLALFAGVGLTLEALNGLKLGFYLDANNALRRELWRLGHAHGTLLSIVQIGYASALAQGWLSADRGALASFLLRGALVLLPLGFLLGGAAPSESDPWIGIWFVPVGGVFLVLGSAVVAWEALRSRASG